MRWRGLLRDDLSHRRARIRLRQVRLEAEGNARAWSLRMTPLRGRRRDRSCVRRANRRLMPAMTSTDPGDYLDITSFEPVALDDLQNPLVQQAVAYWRARCGQRRFPAREDLDQRALLPFQPHMILLKAIDGGNDFEYRFVGEAQRRAYLRPYEGRRISDPANTSPYSQVFFAGYRCIQKSGTPFAIRGWAGKDFTSATFAYFESVVLPLGTTDDNVDHLAIFSAYAPRSMTER
jgi:hypothetical protein